MASEPIPLSGAPVLPVEALPEVFAAEVKASLTAPPLARHDLLHGPVEDITAFGPWMAPPGTRLAADLERVRSIIQGLEGPGRVPLRDGIQVAVDLLQRLLDGVER